MSNRASHEPKPSSSAVPAIASELVRSPGEALDASTRAALEPRAGFDLRHVRVHHDTDAAAVSQSLHAQAFTAGPHISFAAGRYDPTSAAGQRLLLHEIAHTVQQASATTNATPMSHALAERREREADAAAETLARGASLSSALRARLIASPAFAIQRQPDLPEDAVVRGVTDTLEQKGIAYTTQVKARLTVDGLPPVDRRFDLAYQEPGSGEWRFVEGKGGRPQSMTPNEVAVDQALQTRGGKFEILEVGGKPPGAVRVRGIQFTRGFTGQIKPGGLQYVTGRYSPRVPAPSEPNQMNLSEWREWMKAHADVPKDPNAVRVTRPNQAPTRITQADVPNVRGFERRTPTVDPRFQKPLKPPTPQPRLDPASSPEPGIQDTAAPVPKVQDPAAAVPKVQDPRPPALKVQDPAPPPARVAGNEPPVVAPRETGVAVEAPKGGGLVRGLAVGAAVTALDALNRWDMAVRERPRIAAAIQAEVKSAPVQGRISQLVHDRRLDIARKQHAGATVYVTVRLQASVTNDVLNNVKWTGVTLTDDDQGSYTQAVMSHDGISLPGLPGAEHATGYAAVSTPLPAVEVSRSESLAFDLETTNTQIAQAAGPDAALLARREQLTTQVAQAQREEQQARDAEVRRAAVLADRRKRDEQQRRLSIELAESARRRAASSAPAPAPVQQRGQFPSLMPQVQQDEPTLTQTFLPGAQGPGPIEIAAQNVKRAEAYTLALVAQAARFEQDMPSSNDPAGKAFAASVLTWQQSMKYLMNYYTKESRGEAVNKLGELVDRYGGKLEQMRSRFSD